MKQKLVGVFVLSSLCRSIDEVDVYAKAGQITVVTNHNCWYRPCPYSPKRVFSTNIWSLLGRNRLADHIERGKAAVIHQAGREQVTIYVLSTVEEETSFLLCCWQGEEGNEEQKENVLLLVRYCTLSGRKWIILCLVNGLDRKICGREYSKGCCK